MTRATAITTSVLLVWCTTTLSMITCVTRGVASAMSWMKSDAASTSRQTARWRSSSAQNQRKPKLAAAGAPSPRGAAADAGSWRTRMSSGSTSPSSSAAVAVRGVCSPARK